MNDTARPVRKARASSTCWPTFLKLIFKLLKDQTTLTQYVNYKKANLKIRKYPLVVRFRFFPSEGMEVFILFINMLKDRIESKNLLII
jgi:hypothetical protein